MTHTLMLVPTGQGTGLTTAVLGLFHALERQGLKVHFFKPISQQLDRDGQDRSVKILSTACGHEIAEPMAINEVERMMRDDRGHEGLEELVKRYESSRAGDEEIVIVEGMVPTRTQPYASRINKEIAKALDAEVIIVSTPGSDNIETLQDHIDITARAYGGIRNPKVIGCILNMLGAPIDADGNLCLDATPKGELRSSLTVDQITEDATLFNDSFRLIAGIPWRERMMSPRVSDICQFLNAEVLSTGQSDVRRVHKITLCAQRVENLVDELTPGTLVFAPGDRDDIVMAVCLAALDGVDLSALVLTGGVQPHKSVLRLCRNALATGLPLLSVESDIWQIAQALPSFNSEVPADDLLRIEKIQGIAASFVDSSWLQSLTAGQAERRLSPPAFRYQLIKRARRADKHIVLPEGDEPRTIKAAAICADRGIARCTLLGDPQEIRRIAEGHGIQLGDGVEIYNPELIRSHYVDRMMELRAHRGLTVETALDQLKDNVVLGTMMLERDHVDGLVSGAVHTTANTIRPPLQLIKTAPQSNLVSSVFFMCLPEQVLVYGDCAINPDPNAEELADIAIQSADSAKAFGIPPRVAMISYSTGSSGQGADVEKVRRATEIAQAKRPDLLIDGPMQYDAAIMESVARSKAPDSEVAGRATVFVFPDLNTGNTTYKAVQRSADVISIGPMLQGMRKPVNDLSRGALVDDIVYTIALTAIQAANPAPE
ncbi:phosphate acetyltransferase [Motiliproteus coralliicola]|uniref:Phosphate acetyltransferase n=1 Tax=Motiliproteus coralliicola TaxID=2283196 RepID=A0A369WTR5_9GAMM|nr:phosphate acetyltransferase [Motiliproteus coralliicola]